MASLVSLIDPLSGQYRMLTSKQQKMSSDVSVHMASRLRRLAKAHVAAVDPLSVAAAEDGATCDDERLLAFNDIIGVALKGGPGAPTARLFIPLLIRVIYSAGE